MPRNDRRVLYSPGYVALILRQRADLFALSTSHQRDYMALQREVEELRAELDKLRALAGVRDSTTRLN